jgi:hypothetical protein
MSLQIIFLAFQYKKPMLRPFIHFKIIYKTSNEFAINFKNLSCTSNPFLRPFSSLQINSKTFHELSNIYKTFQAKK